MALKIGKLLYGGGGLPRTKKIGQRTYHLFNWGPAKPRPKDIKWAKEKTGAKYARSIKIGKQWAVYVAE